MKFNELITSNSSLSNLIKELFLRAQRPKDLTIACLIISFIVSLIAYLSPIPSHIDNVLYFLSSVSQGLAAIFALEFTIIIFAVQMAKSYTSINKLFDIWTILLMILFIIGIVSPLIQLIVNRNYLPFDRIVNISLAFDLFLVTFCVSSIIPYLIRVKRIMKYEGGMSNLVGDASEAIDSNYKIKASNNINELIEMCKDSINDKVWDKTDIIVEKLEFLGCEIVDKKWVDSVLYTLNGIREIGTQSWYKNINTTVKVTKSLGAIVSKCASKQLDGVPLYFGTSLSNRSTTQYIDFDESSNDFDYDLMCNRRGIENPKAGILRVLNIIGQYNSHDTSLKLSLSDDYGKWPKSLECYDIVGIPNKIENERHLKDFERFGIGRYSSLPQQAMKELNKIGVKAATDSQYAQGFAIASSSLNELVNIGVSSIDNDLSDGTVSMCSYCIYSMGRSTVDEGVDAISEYHKLTMLLPYVLEGLENIANRTYIKGKNKFENSYKASLGFIWILGVYSSRYLPKYAENMASELKKSEIQVIKDEFGSEDIRKDVREYFKKKDFTEEIKKFEDMYDNAEATKLDPDVMQML